MVWQNVLKNRKQTIISGSLKKTLMITDGEKQLISHNHKSWSIINKYNKQFKQNTVLTHGALWRNITSITMDMMETI